MPDEGEVHALTMRVDEPIVGLAMAAGRLVLRLPSLADEKAENAGRVLTVLGESVDRARNRTRAQRDRLASD